MQGNRQKVNGRSEGGSARSVTTFSLLPLSLCLLFVIAADVSAAQRRARAGAPAKTAANAPAAQANARTLTVKTEPRATVWLDNLRRGVTDATGQLVVNNVRPGRHTLRVRAAGFNARTLPLLPSQRGTVEVKLTRATDEAEILFQRAEDLREGVAPASAPEGGERQDAAALYRRAIELRGRFPEARVGLARLLLARDEFDAALEEARRARRERPGYAEASVVEGRVLREMAQYDDASAAYRRSIREARGFQPEAHTGLGVVMQDNGDHAGAVEMFRKAIAQLDDTEPVLYQMLGAAYEKLENWKGAADAYERYLRLAPDGKLAPAIRSIIDQLRQQAAEQAPPNL